MLPISCILHSMLQLVIALQLDVQEIEYRICFRKSTSMRIKVVYNKTARTMEVCVSRISEQKQLVIEVQHDKYCLISN